MEAFQSGFNVREACWQSGISHEAYYQRLRNDDKFADIMAQAQNQITMKSKKLVAHAVTNGDLSIAKWWLEHKASKEFGKSQDDGVSEELRSLQAIIGEVVDSVEEIICQRYRRYLFVQREQKESSNLRSDQPAVIRLDKLLKLSNTKLVEYIELEISATKVDKSGVWGLLQQRQSLVSDMQLRAKAEAIG
ncbi:MAG TPA: hypothetical protein VLG11_01405 [Candidatus Saccharimonadales bacterium]|nr:hypothetical protein [Candidatus Saccharimonadales bacterium]